MANLMWPQARLLGAMAVVTVFTCSRARTAEPDDAGAAPSTRGPGSAGPTWCILGEGAVSAEPPGGGATAVAMGEAEYGRRGAMPGVLPRLVAGAGDASLNRGEPREPRADCAAATALQRSWAVDPDPWRHPSPLER